MDTGVDVRYTMSGDARLAFRVRAGGPHPMVWVPSWISNQDLEDLVTQPVRGPLFERLSSFATSVSYDQRSTGLSDPASLADLPTLEGWTDDLHAVVTAAGLERVVLCGPISAGPVAMLYAATRPERTRALILVNSFAAMARSEDYEAGVRPEEYERYVGWVDHVWGSGRYLRTTMPDVHVDDAQLRELARIERQSMPPAVVGAILRQVYATDVRAVLPVISAPTLVLHTVENRFVPIEHGRYLAQHIPNARLVELPGADLQVFLGSAVGAVVIDEIEEFLTGTRAAADPTRMLTTLLFTDVVGSTDRVAAIGDRAWHTVLDRHDDAVSRQLARFSGHQEKLTGDGMLATFDGPARAIRCGTAIRDAARQLGLEVRVGIHTGEVERRGTELAGIAVHLARRVCGTAQPGEVLVSRTVVDLVAGSGTTFDDRGEHELKGIPAAWRLFAVTT
ncbi:MAG TPA: adenylate/guanylate cyclase domain-containing protein [Acidimicrobiales bacterium]|nr:adenylate/guanylate cyclase domain-containing protein [Acidimicrobiales bacterium]